MSPTTRKAALLWGALFVCAVAVWAQGTRVEPGSVRIVGAVSRALAVSRSTAADAGIQVSNSAGTFALAIDGSGNMTLQDDSDGSPRLEMSGSAATLVGPVTVGNSTLLIQNGTSAGVDFHDTGATATEQRWLGYTDNGTWLLATATDGGAFGATAFSIARSGTTPSTASFATAAVANSGRYNSATLQPGFLAYNSATDASVGSGSTIDFDSEVYDEAGNFAADVFTAPVSGRYLVCGTVPITPASSTLMSLDLVTTAASYRLDSTTALTTEWVGQGCVIVPLSATDTAYLIPVTSGPTVTISGGSTRVTYFSARLLP